MMRIVQLLPELNEGGVERGVADLNREFIKKGIENIVISNGGILVDQILKDGGKHIQYDICSKNILTVPLRVFRLRKILKKINPDIIHVRSRVPAWLVYFANRSLKFKVVSTVHGFNSVNLYSKIMTKADRIICGSSFMIEHIIKHYQVPKEKIKLIPRGIDLDYFNHQDLDENFINNFIAKYNLKEKIVLTQVARITQWKDQKTTIKAFAKLKKEYKNAVLLLVGGYRKDKEGYYSQLEMLVKNLDLENDIIFVGHTNKIKEIFSLAKINISSSYKPETFGRANVEGMFLGVPLVGTNVGATSDYIIEGKTGYYFEPENENDLYDKLLLALKTEFNKGYISNFSKEKFSLKSMVEKNIEVYKSI